MFGCFGFRILFVGWVYCFEVCQFPGVGFGVVLCFSGLCDDLVQLAVAVRFCSLEFAVSGCWCFGG